MTSARPVARWTVVAVAAALALPLVVAAVQMRTPTWHPVLDLAMTELRVRDVGTTDTPLIGLPGRIGESLEEQGSHPGPLSFYALAPTYRLLGSSAWAMQVGSALIHLVAITVALFLARRRGGPLVVASVAAVLALLISGLGTGALTEPWNPYLPLLWWVVLLLAVWSTLAGDVAVLPVAVIAGSFCAQTHVPYLSLSVGLGVAAAVWVAWRARRADPDSEERDQAVWALAAAGLIGVLLWLPPTLDQIRNDPGNYATLVDHFTTPPEGEDPIGIAAGADEAVTRLDLWHLGVHATGDPALLTNGSADRFPTPARGAVLLVAWGIAVVSTLRPGRREPSLLALHALVAGAFALGFFSITRIFGLTWYYLMLWMWAVAALMAFATAWTAWRALARRRDTPMPARAVGLALAGFAVLLTAHTIAADATDAEPSDAEVSAVLGDLVPDTVAALERGEGAATGRDGRYHVTWKDSFHIGSQGFGLMSELEREGFDAGLPPLFRVPATEDRVVDASEATAQIVLVTGRFLADFRERPEAVEIAFVDPRSDRDVARFDGLRGDVISSLRTLGFDEMVPLVDDNLFALAVDARLPAELRREVDEMLAIGTPTAVFVLPQDAVG